MSDHVNKNYNQPFAIAILMILALMGGVVLLGMTYTNVKRDLAKNISYRNKLLDDMNKLVDNISILKTDKKTYQQTIEKMKQNIADIKDKDDLIKRDIFLYIDSKYQLIPRSVATDIALQIVEFAKKENMPPELIIGIIEVESSFNPMAISKKNARGLMQIMPEWKDKFNLQKVSDLHDIDTNIATGIKILKIHIQDDGKGSITKGLYYYVGKNKSYASKVYEAMGRFVAFRSTIDNDKTNTEEVVKDPNEAKKVKKGDEEKI